MQNPAPPSTANIAIACAIIGGVTGYMIGQAKSLGLFGGNPVARKSSKEKNGAEIDSDESDDDESAPAEFPNNPEECKLVLVVRTDLGMTKGMGLYVGRYWGRC